MRTSLSLARASLLEMIGNGHLNSSIVPSSARSCKQKSHQIREKPFALPAYQELKLRPLLIPCHERSRFPVIQVPLGAWNSQWLASTFCPGTMNSMPPSMRV
jgi:hypothetical protein